MNYIDFVSDFLEAPEAAARQAVEERPFFIGAVGFAVSGLSLYLAQSLAGGSRASLISMTVTCVWQVISGFAMAGFLHLIADGWGGAGRGTASGLFVMTGLSQLAWALAVPGVLLMKLFFIDHWLATYGLLAVVGLVSAVLKARSIRHVYQISSARAWAILLLPYVAAIVLLFSVFSIAIFGLFRTLVRLMA